MPSPLEGMKVLDFSQVLVGPAAAMILGDLGAEVVKVERPGGDETRTWPPTMPQGESGYFMMINRNKKSVILNLKEPQAREIARSLAAQMDVVVENFTPGMTEKLGIDYESCRRENPGLVYCSLSGFGQDGPYRDKKAYDPIIQGMTGLMSVTGERGRSPVKVGIPITDLAAALKAMIAFQAAYIRKLSTGVGQYIDVALYDSMISLLTVMAMEYFVTDAPPERWGMDHIHRVPARAFECKDGLFVQCTATNEVMYPAFCRAVGLPELSADPRFDTNRKRVERREEIMPLFQARFLEKNSDEWLRILEAADLPCGPVLDLADVFADPNIAAPNIAARDLCFEMPHPVEGAVKQLGFPWKFSCTPASARLAPPLLGEHTDEILSSWLGLSGEDITALRERRVI